jgi:hypothetical protein
MFRLFAQEIDYFTDDWTTDAQPPQDSFVFKKDFIAHQPDKRIPFDPIPEQFGAWILRSDLRRLESRDSCYQDGRINNASRPFAFLCAQRR